MRHAKPGQQKHSRMNSAKPPKPGASIREAMDETRLRQELTERITELEKSYLSVKEENELLSKRLNETHALYKIAAMLNSIYDSVKLYPLIQHMVSEISFVSQFALLWKNPDQKIEVTLFAEKAKDQELTHLLPLEREVAEEVLNSQHELFIPSITALKNPRALPLEGAGSLLATPLSASPRTDRCLCFYAAHELTATEADFLNLIANEIAIALNRVDIYHETLEVSLKDELTGTYNRRYFNDRFARELNRAERYRHPLSIIMIDIDFFKKFNDTYGHHVGDEVLKGVAGQLSVGLRECDVLARFGGEEFVIILPETGKEGAVFVAEKTRKRVEDKLWEFRNTLRSDTNPEEFIRKPVTISLGVCTYPEDGSTGDALVENADQHLYKAKIAGRNSVSF
jgi:diguanylate cyclase (GGDEF)-like protein